MGARGTTVGGAALTARSDVQVIESIGRGDQEALGELYDRFASAAYGLAVRVLRDPDLAEDAVQDAFLSVWRSAGSFDRRRGGARAWVLTLVHRRAVDLVQRNERIREQSRAEVELEGPSAADVAVLNDERRRVVAALADLPRKQRAALALAYYGGLTQEQIAVHLDLPLGTVKGQIFYGLKRLQKLLSADPEPTLGRAVG